MGDSDMVNQLTLFTLLIFFLALVVFGIAWRVPYRMVRMLAGFFLLILAVTCYLFSILTSLLVAVLGVITLILASKTAQNAP